MHSHSAGTLRIQHLGSDPAVFGHCEIRRKLISPGRNNFGDAANISRAFSLLQKPNYAERVDVSSLSEERSASVARPRDRRCCFDAYKDVEDEASRGAQSRHIFPLSDFKLHSWGPHTGMPNVVGGVVG